MSLTVGQDFGVRAQGLLEGWEDAARADRTLRLDADAKLGVQGEEKQAACQHVC